MRKPNVVRGRRKGKKLNVLEKAEVKALTNLGHSSYGVSKRTGINVGTIEKYLRDQEAYSDPKMMALVEEIQAHEIEDLTVLTVRARARLHDIANRMNPIEALALMDRSFQQRRLLQGKSTENIATLHKIIIAANKDLED